MTPGALEAALAATWPGALPEMARFGTGALLGFAAPVGRVAISPGSRLPAVPHWPGLAITREIWAEAGLSAAELASGESFAGPRTVLLVRADDLPAGAAFVAVHDGIAMIHVIEVRERLRRKGAAAKMVRTAAAWAQDVGASTFSFVTHERNLAARALAASQGLDLVGQIEHA